MQSGRMLSGERDRQQQSGRDTELRGGETHGIQAPQFGLGHQRGDGIGDGGERDEDDAEEQARGILMRYAAAGLADDDDDHSDKREQYARDRFEPGAVAVDQ